MQVHPCFPSLTLFLVLGNWSLDTYSAFRRKVNLVWHTGISLQPRFPLFFPVFPYSQPLPVAGQEHWKAWPSGCTQQWITEHPQHFGQLFTSPQHLQVGSLTVLKPWQGKWQYPHPAKPLYFISAFTHTSPFFRVTRRKFIFWCSISLVWVRTTTVFKWWFLPPQL